jgi:hypothetical protein
VFVADFKADGKLDILTSDGTMNLGNGGGTFKLGTRVAGGVLAVADFNGDGKPDLLEQGTGTLLVLLGNGDGTFQAPISTPSGATLGPVAAIDLTGDGKVDVVGIFNSSLFVYIGKGDGTFATGVAYNLGATSVGEAILSSRDFNSDGKIDIAVSISGNGVPGEEIVFLGDGDGTFQTTARTSAGVISPTSGVVGDFNGDGKLDLVLSTTAPKVYVLLGNGDGTFQAPVAALPSSGLLAAADLNGDGKLDLVLQSDPTVSQVYLGNGDGTFSNANNYILSPPTPPASSSWLALADFNGNGKPDIAAGNAVLVGNGNGTFQGIPLGAVPDLLSAAVVGTFIKNGAPGVAALSNQNVYILENNSSGVLSLAHTYALIHILQQPAIVTADFNGDGNLDLLVVGSDPTTLNWSYSVLLGNGDGSFQLPIVYPQSVYTGNLQSFSVAVADFNNDRKFDVAISSGNQSLALLLGNGDGTFAAPSYVFDAGASPLVVADFNGDGKMDIAAGNGILFGNGDGTFQPEVFPTSLTNFYGAQFTADFNNDGKPDLLSALQVALGHGDGTFTLLPAALPGQVNAVADFNGDGKPDVLITLGTLTGSEFQLQTGILLGNGDGTFGSMINVPTTGLLPATSVVADMNGDGRPDIVFPWHSAVNGVGVMLNTTPPSFALTASAPSPTPVVAGSSAASTVTVTATFGFNQTVTLACAGLPSGTSCGFNPPSVGNSSGTSKLTIATTASAAGTYAVQVQGSTGSIVNSVPLSLVVQAAPDFTIAAGSGSPTSQTISAGQTASFNLELGPTGSFSGTVNLTCAVTPVVSPAPTCNLSNSSVHMIGGTQSVTVKVGTTASVTTSVVPPITFPLMDDADNVDCDAAGIGVAMGPKTKASASSCSLVDSTGICAVPGMRWKRVVDSHHRRNSLRDVYGDNYGDFGQFEPQHGCAGDCSIASFVRLAGLGIRQPCSRNHSAVFVYCLLTAS